MLSWFPLSSTVISRNFKCPHSVEIWSSKLSCYFLKLNFYFYAWPPRHSVSQPLEAVIINHCFAQANCGSFLLVDSGFLPLSIPALAAFAPFTPQNTKLTVLVGVWGGKTGAAKLGAFLITLVGFRQGGGFCSVFSFFNISLHWNLMPIFGFITWSKPSMCWFLCFILTSPKRINDNGENVLI